MTPWLSFDECVLTSTSRRNTIKSYTPDKPHRRVPSCPCCVMLHRVTASGMLFTKVNILSFTTSFYLFVQHVVDSRSTWGKQQHDAQRFALDNKTSPAAVVKNLEKVLASEDKSNGWRVITVDRYYTSVALLLRLLSMKVYTVGTTMINRLGYCHEVIDKSGRRAASRHHGEFKMAHAMDVPSMMALSWTDSTPVHYPSTGAAACSSTVYRQACEAVVAVRYSKNCVRLPCDDGRS